MKLGLIGLGRMGSRMVLKLLREGHEVVVWNRSPQPVEELKVKAKNEKLQVADSAGDLVGKLEPVRIVWSMLPAGEPTQTILDQLAEIVEMDDILIDGGNAYYKDTEKRFKYLKNKGMRYLGIGVSGGVIAAEKGYPLMVGGDKSAYEHTKPILDSLSRPHGGHEYFGQGGVGHFIKMVHNGIEYSYMQGLSEGFGILQNSPYHLDLAKAASLYRKGTLLSGFMMDRAYDALHKDLNLKSSEGTVGESGEARWTIEAAHEEEVPVENIHQALEFRIQSQTDPKVQSSFAAKMLNALRKEFGGHEIKKK